MRDILIIFAVLSVLSVAMVFTKIFGKRLSPEASRKIIHITMGITALSFPFVFEHKLSIIPLAIIAIISLLILRYNKTLKSNIGSPLLGVARKSFGEIYFTISIMIVFLLYQNIVEYLIPILVLTFADSAAALVGVKYGQKTLSCELEDKKSGEGSTIFFIVAFLCTLVPLQLLTDIGRAEVLLISFLIGVLAAMVETICQNGKDNLLLPLLIYSFIIFNVNRDVNSLIFNFVAMIIFWVIDFIIYRMVTISKLSAAYAILAGYVIMIQGGLLWIVPPLMLYATFGILPKQRNEEKSLILPFKVIECNVIVGLICLWCSTIYTDYISIWFLGFCLSFACHLMINTYNRFVNFITANKKEALFAGIIKSAFFIIIPSFVIRYILFDAISIWEVCLFMVLWGCFIPVTYYLCNRFDYKRIEDRTLYINEFAVGSITALFVLGGILWTILS